MSESRTPQSDYLLTLVQENMPDVDASGVKKSLRQRRPPWELVITKEQESV